VGAFGGLVLLLPLTNLWPALPAPALTSPDEDAVDPGADVAGQRPSNGGAEQAPRSGGPQVTNTGRASTPGGGSEEGDLNPTAAGVGDGPEPAPPLRRLPGEPREHTKADLESQEHRSWTSVDLTDVQWLDGRPVVLRDGAVLLTGGLSARKWDPTSERWAPAGKPGIFLSNHAQVVLADGDVLAVGGYLPPETGPYVGAEPGTPMFAARYSSATGRWVTTEALPCPRRRCVARVMPDGSVALFGGFTEPEVAASRVDYFDPSSNRWRTSEATLGASTDVRAIKLRAESPTTDGWLAIVHGAPTVADVAVLAGPRVGAIANGAWGKLAADPTRLLFSNAERVEIVSGNGVIVRLSAEYTDGRVVGALRIPRRDFAWTRLSNGKFLVVGGMRTGMHRATISELAGITAPELWDPSTRTSEIVGPYRRYLDGVRVVALRDGRAMLIGRKFDAKSGNSLVELFNPSSPKSVGD
jgi:hypothetical protein